MEIPGNYAPGRHRSLISSRQCGDRPAPGARGPYFRTSPNFRTRYLSLCSRPGIDLSPLLCHARVGHRVTRGLHNLPYFPARRHRFGRSYAEKRSSSTVEVASALGPRFPCRDGRLAGKLLNFCSSSRTWDALSCHRCIRSDALRGQHRLARPNEPETSGRIIDLAAGRGADGGAALELPPGPAWGRSPLRPWRAGAVSCAAHRARLWCAPPRGGRPGPRRRTVCQTWEPHRHGPPRQP